MTAVQFQQHQSCHSNHAFTYDSKYCFNVNFFLLRAVYKDKIRNKTGQTFQSIQNSPSSFLTSPISWRLFCGIACHSGLLSDQAPFHSVSLPHGFRTRTKVRAIWFPLGSANRSFRMSDTV